MSVTVGVTVVVQRYCHFLINEFEISFQVLIWKFTFVFYVNYVHWLFGTCQYLGIMKGIEKKQFFKLLAF